ncbi:MAG: FAD-dependent oxidoreductase [Oscillospiraceae bacterium]|jgi:NAD(P)H-nitrite reductase large subunit|nr:FAD-dependent oxidoreductase [Oscillospiraceae bacterium]
MKIVIIGNSAAAVGCIEGIRLADKNSEILVITNEAYHTYSRPLISYLLAGKTDLERMKYRPDSFYEDNGVNIMFGTDVTSVDSKSQTVHWLRGNVNGSVPYDKLLIATGSVPFVPPMSGLESVKKQTTFMSLDDAKFLQENVTPTSRVFIIGAGLIGLKCAEGLSEITGDITVCDLAPQILPSILDKDAANLMQKVIAENGVKLLLGDTADKFDGNTAYMKSGAVVEFDVLVLAVGVRSNVALAKDAGAEVSRGIVTDEFARTTLVNVYAAGDCAESFDISANVNRVLALLPNAYAQGRTAGLHIAGITNKPYDNAIPMNAIGFWGTHILSAGSYSGDLTIETDGETYYRLTAIENGKLVGYIRIGDIRRAGIYTDLIRSKTAINKLSVDITKTSPGLAGFSKEARFAKLGGVER